MASRTIIIAGSPVQYLRKIRECWQYRELMRMLSYRDTRVRYAQTFLGLSWAVINPLISMFLLYFVFGIVARVDTQGVPPLLFVMAGLLPWTYFSRVVAEAGNSIVGAQSLVKKIYFPRLVIPVSKAFSALIDLIIVAIMLIALILIYDIRLDTRALLIIPIILMTVFASLGFGIWVAALTIRFRDFSHILPLLLRIGMFVSPIAYSASSVPEKYQWAFQLNPLTGIIEATRWALFDVPIDPESVWISCIVIFVVLLTGTWYFLKMDQYIADII